MVKLWHLDGSLMTVLRAYGAVAWTFPITADTIGLEEETLEKVRQTVRNAKDKQKVAVEEQSRKTRARATLPVFSLDHEIAIHRQRFEDQDEMQKMQQRLKGPTGILEDRVKD